MAGSVSTLNNRITDRERLLACTLVSEQEEYSKLIEEQNGIKLSRLFDEYFNQNLIKLMDLGWELYDGVIERRNEYKGLLFVNQNKQCFLLVHRGMQPNIPNMANCFMIGNEENPPIVNDALKMCDRAIKAVNEKYPEYEIYHTGFSMGGFLAQITATYCHHKEKKHNKAVGYDCPGAKFVIDNKQWQDNRENITIYLMDINLVNTATKHYGHVRQVLFGGKVSPWPWPRQTVQFTLNSLFQISRKNSELALIILHRTIETHKTQDLLDFLDENNQKNLSFRHILYWPIAENRFHGQASEFAKTSSSTNSRVEQRFFNLIKGKVTHTLAQSDILATQEKHLVEHDIDQARKIIAAQRSRVR